jgi:hypothetical protein
VTHESSHVIISGRRLSAQVSFGEDAEPTKVKFWHVLVALVAIGFLVGLAF